MLKMQPKVDWEKQRKEEDARVRLARAVGAAMLRDPYVFREEKFARDLEEIADILPTISVIEELAKIDVADAALLKTSAVSAGRSRNRKPKPRKATPAKKKKPARAVAKPKRARRDPNPAAGRPRGKADLAIAGALEDHALDLANANGSVTAGELLDAKLGATRNQVSGALGRLVTRGRLVQTGKGRHTKYSLANGAGAKKAQLELDEAQPS